MAFQNVLQISMMRFVQRAKKEGWTEEETREVVMAVQKEVNDNLCRCCGSNIDSILAKHAIPVVERKRREKEQFKKKE